MRMLNTSADRLTEPPDIARAGDAIFVVAVDRDRRACAVGDADDAAALVGAEARILIEAWRRHYNTVRPHSSLGYRPPAPEAVPSMH